MDVKRPFLAALSVAPLSRLSGYDLALATEQHPLLGTVSVISVTTDAYPTGASFTTFVLKDIMP